MAVARFSSRARDLADVEMIAAQADVDGAQFLAHVRREEKRRLDAGTLLDPLPKALDLDESQLEDWRDRWEAATRRAPVTLDDALAGAKAFLDPALANKVADALWSADERRWIARRAG